MKIFPATTTTLVAAAVLLVTLTAAAEPTCDSDVKTEYDCTTDSYEDFTRPLLLEYTTGPFPEAFCKDLSQYEELLVESYNELARLTCDSPCFRRATKAQVVTKACGVGSDKDKHKDKHARDRRHRRHLKQFLDDRVVLVELFVEQSGGCYTALDAPAPTEDAPALDAGAFAETCGMPAADWMYYEPSYYDKKYRDKYPYQDYTAKCCCPCDTQQPLTETDLLALYKKNLALAELPCDFVSLMELESVSADCGINRAADEHVVLL